MIKTRRLTKALILILPAFLANCIRNVSGLLSSIGWNLTATLD